MNNNCIYCNKPVEDYEPRFCCSGFECGCQGQPIDPPAHNHCAVINIIKKTKEEDEKSNMRLGASTKLGNNNLATLFNGKKTISNSDITKNEAFHIVSMASTIHCIASWSDYIIEILEKEQK